METEDKNMQIIITILTPLLGMQLMKQIICVVLLMFDVEEKKIRDRLNVSYNTIKKYVSLLENDRLSELFEDKRYKPKSQMDDYRDEIMAELDKNPARTLREAAVIIEKTTGLKRSLPQVRNFLKKTDTSH